MKKIFVISFIIVFFTLASLSLIFLKVADYSSKYDLNYSKLSSSKQSSLIIGTSRAAQGIDPILLDSITQPILGNCSMYNYAFNLGCSPFGPAYYKAIINKVSQDQNDSLKMFIVTVDPWSISDFKEVYQPKEVNHYEDLTFLGKIDQFSGNPNYSYLIKSFRRPLYSVFITDKSKPTVRNRGAYLLSKHEYSQKSIDSHVKAKMESYRKKQFSKKQFSQKRYAYFEKTISELKKYGQVIIVRLPVSKEMRNLEMEYMPTFSEKIELTSEKLRVPFYNPFEKSGEYLSVDGNHLHGSGVINFTIEMGQYINQELKR